MHVIRMMIAFMSASWEKQNLRNLMKLKKCEKKVVAKGRKV